MKRINDWIVIKALNRHDNLVVRLEKGIRYSSFRFELAIMNKGLGIIGEDVIYIDTLLDLKQFLLNIEKVMSGHTNDISLYDLKEYKRDIRIKKIDEHKQFKVTDALKMRLSYRQIDQKNIHNEVTLSKDSARDLYKCVLVAIKQIESGELEAV
jgi:hypothetical protein